MNRHATFGWLAVLVLALPGIAHAQIDINEETEKAMKAAAAKVAASVVRIETSGGQDIIVWTDRASGAPIRKVAGPTTGLVVDADGYIITSSFNFANKPTSIFVAIPGQKERKVAKVVAKDTSRMVTLLKVDATDLPVPTAVPAKDVKVGQTSLALGRTFDTQATMPTVSEGIISAIGRIWGKCLQTDAKVSPTNFGGPLVDLDGRVFGVLVPASPQGEDETAGYEWYDSGIGFAVPLEDVFNALPRLKDGKDLKKGLLGITPQSPDRFGVPPAVGSIQPNSAAAKAEMKVGDVITEVDGKVVRNMAQLLHALGPKYEGDTVNLTLKRGNEEIKLQNVRLGGPGEAAPLAWLGILPMRDDPEPGLEVRYVYPKSPADAAGLKAGDRIEKLGVGAAPPAPFSGRDQFQQRLVNLLAGTEVKLEVKRKDGGKTETVTVKAGEMVEALPPDELPKEASVKKALEPRKQPGGQPPPAPPAKDDKEKKKPDTGLIERKNASGARTFWVYVPKDYDPNVSYALVVWLHPVNKGKKDDFKDLTDAWEDYCTDNHLIMVGPKAESDTVGWVPGESEFILETVRDVMNTYTIDQRRVVAHGMGAGGQMAFYFGFSARDLVRGVATTGAALTGQPKDRVGTQPLSFFLIAGGKDPLAKPIAETKTKLTEHKYPVIHKEIPNMGHQYLDEETLKELVKWIDALDKV